MFDEHTPLPSVQRHFDTNVKVPLSPLVDPTGSSVGDIYALQNIPAYSEFETHNIMSIVGYDVVLAYISSGTIPATLASHYRVPLNHFKTWLQDHPHPETVQEAIKACADSLVAKAMAVLAARSPDKTTLAKNRYFADQLMLMAERLNPETWAPPKKFEAPPPMVNIVIGDNKSGAFGGIPGLDALIVNK